MDHKGILSSAFNMSLGFIPVIISILLCEFITQDTADYHDTDDNKVKYTENQSNSCRNNSSLRPLCIQAFVTGTYLFQEMVDESFLVHIEY